MPEKVLVVEDEPAIALGLVDNLEMEGYEVDMASDGAAGLARALDWTPDLVVLDWMMPNMSGIEVLRELRSRGLRCGVIFLTAKSADLDKVKSLELGADDYVTKPFSVIELLARIKAVLRRRAEKPPETSRLRSGDLSIDLDRMEATRAGKRLELTPRELRILELFVRNPGRVISRNEMLDKVWGYEKFPTTRTVDNHIVNIRKQLGDRPSKDRYIVSVRGRGYKFVPKLEG